MFGFRTKSGPEAISFGNTLFRIEEISWIKATWPSLSENIARGALALLGIAFVVVMADAKQTYLNVECLLALLPVHLALLIHQDLRLASTGDFDESYEDRAGGNRALFREWIGGLAQRHPDWVRLNEGAYDYLVNTRRIAWARSGWRVPIYPLFVAVVFVAYAWVAHHNWSFVHSSRIFTDLTLLQFPGGTGTLIGLCYVVAVACLATMGVSVKPRTVTFCAPGGVKDSLCMSRDDQIRIMDAVAGRHETTRRSIPAPSAPSRPARAPVKPERPPVRPERAPVEPEKQASEGSRQA